VFVIWLCTMCCCTLKAISRQEAEFEAASRVDVGDGSGAPMAAGSRVRNRLGTGANRICRCDFDRLEVITTLPADQFPLSPGSGPRRPDLARFMSHDPGPVA